MSKQTYRTELEIVLEILEYIMESGSNGKNITDITKKANLSHVVGSEKLKKLTDASLVKTIQGEKGKVFVATEQGIKFYQEMGNFQELTSCLRE